MVALTWFGEGGDERRRLPHRPQLRRGPQDPGRLRVPEQRLGHQRPARAADRLGDHRAEGDRLRHARRAGGRERPPRRARRDPARPGAGRGGGGADAPRVRHLPARGPLDLRRPARLPAGGARRAVEGEGADPPRSRRYLARRGALDDAADARLRDEVRGRDPARARARRRRSRRSRRSRACSRTSTPSRSGSSGSSSRSSRRRSPPTRASANPRHSDA